MSLQVCEDTKVEVETKSREKTEADARQAAARRYARDRPKRIFINYTGAIFVVFLVGVILSIVVFLILHFKGYF